MQIKNQLRKVGSVANLNSSMFYGEDASLLQQEIISKGLVNLLYVL